MKYYKFVIWSLRQLEEVDQQLVKHEVSVAEAEMELVPTVERKTKQKRMTEDILQLIKKAVQNNRGKYET